MTFVEGASQTQRPIAVDLFAGAGGMSLGFEQAGFDVLAAVEVDPVHCATYEFNFPIGSVICRSVTDVTGADIRERSAIGSREIDVVMGGAPCQGFSIIGKRVAHDPRNHLIFEFGRLVLELRPKYFVLENVPGMAWNKYRPLLKGLIETLRQDYQIADYRILNAAHYGVPQTRKRLFLLGSRQNLPPVAYPPPLTTPPSSPPLPELPPSPTVADALGDLPEVERYPELLHRDWVLTEFGPPSCYARSLREGSQAHHYAYRRASDPQLLSSSWLTHHTPASIQRFQATPPGCKERISRFYRLHPQGVCNTLRAGTDRQRGSFTAPRPIHPERARCITVREAARLHSYPDWFRFQVTKWHGFRQVGNSVPPLLAQAIAAEIIRCLGVIPIQPGQRYQLGDETLLQLTWSQAARLYL
ncbi:MAG: DNA cytosine methyltransferase [Cyanophyceae cyanobacterium]